MMGEPVEEEEGSKEEGRDLAAEDAEKGLIQVKGSEPKGAAKKRVTYLQRNGLFDVEQTKGASRKPYGKILRSVLVGPGKYFNLDYVAISEKKDGREDQWNRSWSYTIGDETYSYEKGESCANLGLPWRLLKRHYPELFKNLLVIPVSYTHLTLPTILLV